MDIREVKIYLWGLLIGFVLGIAFTIHFFFWKNTQKALKETKQLEELTFEYNNENWELINRESFYKITH